VHLGIVNIGTEEEKGNQLVKETYPLLRDCKNINFVGSVEARDIAQKVDAMIVIGDKSSSNTRKLYEICKGECENTFYIQTLKDLDLKSLNLVNSIGITAGASTPNNIIEEVYTNVREFCRDVS